MTISRANNEKELYFSLLTEPGFLKCGLGGWPPLRFSASQDASQYQPARRVAINARLVPADNWQ